MAMRTTLTDPVLRLIQYWLSARLMHSHVHEAFPPLGTAASLASMAPLNRPPFSSSSSIGAAKTCVARWSDTTGQSVSLRSKLLRGVEAIASELPNRADWFEVITVSLDGGGGLPIRIDGRRHCVTPSVDCLFVSSVVPVWGVGWRKIFKDEDVFNILSWFLHYARQYIHRSDVASVLMVAWETHAKVLHPFGSRVILSIGETGSSRILRCSGTLSGSRSLISGQAKRREHRASCFEMNYSGSTDLSWEHIRAVCETVMLRIRGGYQWWLASPPTASP